MALRALLSRLLGRFAPIFYFICNNKIHRASPCKQITNKKISRIFKKKFVDFQNFQKSNFERQIFENFIIHKPSLGSREIPQKI